MPSEVTAQSAAEAMRKDEFADRFGPWRNQKEWHRCAHNARHSAAKFAALSAQDRIALLRRIAERMGELSEEWVKASCQAKGISHELPVSGEEGLAGPLAIVRNCRLLAESWQRFADGAMPHDGLPAKYRANGTVDIQVFPTSKIDATLFGGFTCTVTCEKLTAQSGPLPVPKAGKTCLVLGAGNVSSIPVMDVLYKLFVEGKTCVLKMNPVNEYLGPIINDIFSELGKQGFVSVAYGGADAGTYLCNHDDIDEVHITGSDKTHDIIVWGPPGPGREQRLRTNSPLLQKPVTSELGNVSPVIIVPGEYKDKELRFMAKNVAAMVANNASCNCNAAKMLVTSKFWLQRVRFLNYLAEELAATPCRMPYYPGATDRYRTLLSRNDSSSPRLLGEGPEGCQQWALVTGLVPDSGDPLFTTEPFCAIISETALAAGSPMDPDGTNAPDFLAAAVKFCNYTLWGTLNCSVMIDPRTEKSTAGSGALERAINDLRYGTVAVNHWPALGYGFVSPPWGAAPHHTLDNVVSGIGWVHNTYMLRGVLKSVIRGPLTVSPKPAWFTDNAVAHVLWRKLVELELDPSWWKVPGVAMLALRG